MSDAAASILPRKIGNKAPNRGKSGFSPDMLRVFCEQASEALGLLLDARVKVALDSVGLEPLTDVIPEEGTAVCAAVVDLNGITGAATVLPDGPALFHIVDIILGGDADSDEAVVDSAPSSLGARFCNKATDALMRALVTACDRTIAPDSCVYSGRVKIVQDGADMLIVPAKSDVMAISLTVSFGQGERKGKVSMVVPLTTIDAVSSAASGRAATQPTYEKGPWFDHMKTSVSLMELETMAVLQKEPMSLAELSRLDIGSVIPVNVDAVGNVQITLADGGDVIATGELGMSSGKRVVSLGDKPNEAFLAPVRNVIEQG